MFAIHFLVAIHFISTSNSRVYYSRVGNLLQRALPAVCKKYYCRIFMFFHGKCLSSTECTQTCMHKKCIGNAFYAFPENCLFHIP